MRTSCCSDSRCENTADKAREVRLFFAHDLRIDESDIGDTAFYYPCAARWCITSATGTSCSAAGRRASRGRAGISQYACGEKGFRGAEGTWRDAEDGLLSMNAIAQGAVDSVGRVTALTVPANGQGVVRTWMAAGENFGRGRRAAGGAPGSEGFEEALAETAGHWQATVPRSGADLEQLPPRVAELFTRSLLIIRTQADKRGRDPGLQRQRHHGDGPRPLLVYVAPRRGAGLARPGRGRPA